MESSGTHGDDFERHGRDGWNMNESPQDRVDIVPLGSCPQFAPVIASWVYFQWSVPMRRSWENTLIRYDPATPAGALPATFVATINGAPAAMASLRITDSYDFLPGTTPWICNVFVHDGARGRGLATLLCRHIVEYAREQGFTELFLATSVESNSLYHGLGFVEVHRVDYFGPKFILRLPLETGIAESKAHG
ncbi:GNAT family N-acetyltransferase [Mesorhizobium sp. Root552]|uniref:GNAT family N-acetyltransferase n=1 Tax=Mesorhizobium sp. Root552 TaxID=1736555 RepID=UPI000A45071F|nr:GNAT family N-acetyltransferase [Mesorhizobium sp. Root552]